MRGALWPTASHRQDIRPLLSAVQHTENAQRVADDSIWNDIGCVADNEFASANYTTDATTFRVTNQLL